MSDALLNGYWLVSVQTETLNKKGKFKKNTEKYLVENCGSATQAEERVKEKMNGTMADSWHIKSVVLQKIDDII